MYFIPSYNQNIKGGCVHTDAHPMQFLHDSRTDRFTALDWDSAIVATPAVQVSYLYDEWVLKLLRSSELSNIESNFEKILEGFEPDEGQRHQLLARALAISALRRYEHANNGIIVWKRYCVVSLNE